MISWIFPFRDGSWNATREREHYTTFSKFLKSAVPANSQMGIIAPEIDLVQLHLRNCRDELGIDNIFV